MSSNAVAEVIAGADRPAADRLLDAAEDVLERFGPSKTSMEDVAQAAGLSRATVYRYFDDRDDLLQKVAVRQASELANEAIQHLAAFDKVSDWIVEGLLFSLREIPKRPVFASLVTSLEAPDSGRLLLGSSQLAEVGLRVLRPMFRQAADQGLLRDNIDIDMLIEWILRSLWTYLNTPSQVATDEDSMRRMFHMMLIPAVLKDA